MEAGNDMVNSSERLYRNEKCAFCKHYFDPTFEVIAPKRGMKDVWEYERGVKKPCLLRNNREMQSQMTCPKFEVRI